MKLCSRCKSWINLDGFHKSRADPSGYHNQCKPCALQSKRESYARHRHIRIADVSRWYWLNKQRKRAYDAKRRADNPDLYRGASKRWRQNNPGKKNADTQTRRAVRRRAMPDWANRFMIQEIYDLAARRTAITGFSWHVDHIVPLKGDLVCGLHVENNLRVIPAIENQKKWNRFDASWGVK